jgi:hypothetical protein
MAEKMKCPSAPCQRGSEILGAIDGNGELRRFQQEFVVDDEFVSAAYTPASRSPTKRFRFVSTCVKQDCAQWKGDHCGVAARIVAQYSEQQVMPPDEKSFELTKCRIRSDCRWFGERGKMACLACKYVITDQRKESEMGSSKSG